MLKLTNEDLEQVKSLILWAKTQNIAILTIKDLSVTFFPEAPKASEFNLDELKAQEKQSEEELILYSSR